MDGANARVGGGMGNDCCGVSNRLKRDGVDITEDDKADVIHRGAEVLDGIARESVIDGAGARRGGDIGNDCWGVGNQCVSNIVSSSETDCDGVVNGGDEDDNVVAREIDVDGASSRGSGSIGNDWCRFGYRCRSDRVGISNDDGRGVLHGDVEGDKTVGREIDVNGANAMRISRFANNCCSVGDRFSNDDVGTKQADGDVDGYGIA